MVKEHEPLVDEILDIFERTYTDPKCELNYQTPFQLLIATVMAAQATDKNVNRVTEKLFEHYGTPKDFLTLSEAEIAEKIKSINFYRTKAKNIWEICRILEQQYGGQVPDTLKELVSLPGVGRKTANVVLSNAFGVPAIAVDTHVQRVSNRLGLVDTKEVLSTEIELERMIPREKWSKAHNYLVLHGRYVCNAKKPKCEICELRIFCRYYNRIIANDEKRMNENEAKE